MLKARKDLLFQAHGLKLYGWLIVRTLKRLRSGDEMNIQTDMNSITSSPNSQWTWTIFQKLSNQFCVQLIADFDLIKELLRKET